MTDETVRIAPPQTPPRLPQERVRFGPGVPAHSAPAPAPEQPDRPRRGRTAAVLSAGLTLGIVVFVVWYLWPSGPLHVRGLTVTATPASVSCNGVADVDATLTTNGNPGTVRYLWERGDGQRSGELRQTLADGQRTANLHLRWTFSGRGSYTATAQLRVLTPDPRTATVRFTYACR